MNFKDLEIIKSNSENFNKYLIELKSYLITNKLDIKIESFIKGDLKLEKHFFSLYEIYGRVYKDKKISKKKYYTLYYNDILILILKGIQEQIENIFSDIGINLYFILKQNYSIEEAKIKTEELKSLLEKYKK